MKIFITGSTRGIGKDLAKKMLSEGHDVLVSSEKELDAKELEGIFGRCKNLHYIKCDISSKADIVKAKEYIEKIWGNLDYLVANAGVLLTPSGAFDISDEDIEKTIAINLIGTFNTVKIIGKFMQKTSKKASIVALTSVDGIIGEPFGIIYSATKAGIISLVKSFAREFENPLVRVNAVAPGLIDTPLTSSTGEEPENTTDISIIKRMGSTIEVSNTIEFLLSDKSSFTTGQVVVVDGGFTLK